MSRYKSRLAGIAVLCLTVMLAFQSCTISYKFNGAALDYNVYKTIRVSQFPIRAALVYPPLQQLFENELLDFRLWTEQATSRWKAK